MFETNYLTDYELYLAGIVEKLAAKIITDSKDKHHPDTLHLPTNLKSEYLESYLKMHGLSSIYFDNGKVISVSCSTVNSIVYPESYAKIEVNELKTEDDF